VKAGAIYESHSSLKQRAAIKEKETLDEMIEQLEQNSAHSLVGITEETIGGFIFSRDKLLSLLTELRGFRDMFSDWKKWTKELDDGIIDGLIEDNTVTLPEGVEIDREKLKND